MNAIAKRFSLGVFCMRPDSPEQKPCDKQPSTMVKAYEKKIALIKAKKEAAERRTKKDDKKWKARFAKFSEDKKKAFKGVAQSDARGRRRGATRRSLTRAKKAERKPDVLTYETTVHLAKMIHGKSFHKKAPTAVKAIRKFAGQLMKTKDNRVDASLNGFIWSRGIKGVPGRVRVSISRKVAEAKEGSSGKRKRLYTVISYVPTTSYKGLGTKTVTASA